jgi:hypothetical protein
MGRNHQLASRLCCLLFVSVFSTIRPVEAGEVTFKIPDYIPQKFTDLRLQITGGANSDNRNNDGWSAGESGAGGILSRAGDRNSSSHSHYLNLGSSGEYRYETVPFRLRCGADLTTNLNYGKSNDEYHQWGEYYERGSTSDNSNHRYAISAKPFFSGVKYVHKDFFVLTDDHLNLSYSRGSGNGHYIDYEAGRPSDDSLSMELWSSSNSSQSRNRGVTFYADVNGAFGFGHIYEGWYAATSLYIINEIRSRSLLEAEPSTEQMKALSALVYQNALQHAIDNRIRLVESMQTILGYLEQQGIIRQGSSSPLIVQDVWSYFPRTSRRFGWQVSIGSGFANNWMRSDDSSFNATTRAHTRFLIEAPEIIDTLVYEHQEGVSLWDSRYHSSSAYLQLKSEYHRAIDLRWQFDTDFALRYYLRPFGWSTHISEESWYREKTNYDDYVTLNGETVITYIVNSRTSATLRGQLAHQSYKLTNTQGAGEGGLERSMDGHLFGISLQMTYRLSIPTTLDFSLEYVNQRYPRSSVGYVAADNYESYGASVRIAHYLF